LPMERTSTWKEIKNILRGHGFRAIFYGQ
jgi:hypothetical protein